MALNLLILPNQVLREKAEPVLKIDSEVKKLVQEMKKIMKKHNGLGLAGNQVGVKKRIFVMEVEGKSYVCINPRIVKKRGKERLMEEGCLSIPNKWGEVLRSEEVILKYQNLWGKEKTLKAKGLLAQVIQHEMDHLEGILFIDKAKNIHEISHLDQ